jgi:hypothetical protein
MASQSQSAIISTCPCAIEHITLATTFTRKSASLSRGGTRLTAGGYNFTRNVVAIANRAGGQSGFEQPLTKKMTLAADWSTGKHAAGSHPGWSSKLAQKLLATPAIQLEIRTPRTAIISFY